MAEEKHHHGLFHHHRKAEDEVPVGAVYVSETTETIGVTETVGYGSVTEIDYEKERKHHKNKEHVGELCGVTAAAFALHEKHKAEKDPEHQRRHRIEEEVAAAVAVGSGGYAFHEHHEKKEAKKEEERVEGKKHHHLF